MHEKIPPAKPYHLQKAIPSSEKDAFFGIEQILFDLQPDIYDLSTNHKLAQSSLYLNLIKNIFTTLSEEQKYPIKQKLLDIEESLRDEINLEELKEELRLIIENIRELYIPESVLIRIKMIEYYLFPDKESINQEEKQAFDREVEEIKQKKLSAPEKESMNRSLDRIIQLFEEKKPLIPLEIHEELNRVIRHVNSMIVNERNRRNT